MKKSSIMPLTKSHHVVLVCTLLFLLAIGARAQSVTDGTTPSGVAPGSPAGSYALSGFENVNLFNGSLDVHVPLLTIGGRGEAVAAVAVGVNPEPWIMKGTGAWHDWWTTLKPGYGPGVLQGRRIGVKFEGVGQSCSQDGLYHYQWTRTTLTFTTSDGTEYELRDKQTGGQWIDAGGNYCSTGPSRGTQFVTGDGTSATFISDAPIIDRNRYAPTNIDPIIFPSGYLTLRNGIKYHIVNGLVYWVRDRNGNMLNFNYGLNPADPLTYRKVLSATDSLGRTVTFQYSASSDTINFAGFGGAPRTITINRAELRTAFRGDYLVGGCQQSGVYWPGARKPSELFPELTPWPGETCYNSIVTTSIVIPGGLGYQFKYNQYGEVARIETPIGGAIEYDMAAGSGVVYGEPNPGEEQAQIHRAVQARRVYVSKNDTTPKSLMTYTVGPPTGDAVVTVDQLDPQDNNKLLTRDKHYFHGNPVASLFMPGPKGAVGPSYPAFNQGRERTTEAYSVVNGVVGSVLRKTETLWEVGPAIVAGAPACNARVKEITSTLSDTNQVAKKVFGYDDSVPYNNQSDVYEYDFGTGAAGGLVRHTHTDYLTATSYTDAVAGAHLRSLPVASRVYSVNPSNGAETLAAQSTITYDEPGYVAPPYPSVTGWIDPGIARGNVTTTGTWLDTTGAYLLTHAQYDQCGNVRKAWDARDTGLTNPSQVSYFDAFSDGVPRNTYAFPTSMTTAVPDPNGTYGSNVALTTTSVYDFNTGKVASTTDANAKTTSYDYSDSLERLKQVTMPDGGRTTYTYVDVHQCGPFVETRTLLDTTGRETDSWQFFDGLGRPYLVESLDNQDPNNPYLRVDTQYDSIGRAWRVSSPYRSAGCTSTANPSGRWRQTTFDALSRPIQIKTTPDNAVVTTSYSGSTVTVTDQTGKTRRSVTDALGRLTRVDEPDSNGNLDLAGTPVQPTSYTYDVLGNLRRVVQGSQQRFFMYDSLSRLIRAKNPEQSAGSIASNLTDPITGNAQWSMAYGYDNNGNLTARVDARNVTTTYAYDALNRNTTVRYTDGTKDIDRHYDNPTANKNGLGRFWFFNWDASQNTRFDSHLAIDQYDAMGRPLIYRQHFLTNGVASQQFNVTRTYDKAGHVLTQTYPSGRSVNYGYDIAGRLNSDGGNLGDGVARTYSTAVTYSEFGGLQQEQFGTQTALYHKLHYTVRGQLYDIRLSTVDWATDQWNWNRGAIVDYYATAGLSCQTNECQGNSGPDNNGNVIQSRHYIPTNDQISSYNWTEDRYSYDSLNRLKSVAEYHGAMNVGYAPQDFAQVYDYDRFGNRTVNQSQTSTNIPHPNYTVDTGNNRLVAPAGYNYAYDNAGNQTNDNYTGQGQRTYDAENRMKQAQGTPNGQWQTYTYDADGRRIKRNVNGVETWQVYGIDGELLAEYASGAAPFLPGTEYGYRNGELLVTITNGDTQRLTRFVTNLYYGAKQRDPSAQELQDGINQLAAAGAQSQSQLQTVANQIARSLFTSTNYETLPPARTEVQYVTDLYYAYLQRAPDDSGLGFWTGQAAGSRVNVCNAFEASGEYLALVANLYGTAASDNERTEHFVNDFYLGAYGRFATPSELQQQRDALNVAAAQSQAAVQAQAETFGRSLFVGQVNDGSLSNTQYVTNLYEGFLQRGPDAGGLSFWSGQASVGQGRQNVLNNFATCPAFRELSGALYREANWLVTDHLGTPRMIVNKSGSLASVKRHDYLPFGEELSAGMGGRTTTQGYTGDSVRQKFTSKERDNETGLDYFGARHYASMQGRFTSVDPYNIVREAQITAQRNPAKAAAQLVKYLRFPQQWNRYAYVANNPLKYVDPTGEYLELTGDTQADRDEALERIKTMVGKDAAKYIHVTEACDSNNKCHYYVESSKNLGQVGGGKLGGYISEIIDSNRGVEYKIADSFTTQYGTYTTAGNHCGGACTVGAEESLTGNTQIFVNKNSDTIASSALHTPLYEGAFSGPNFKMTEDIVDAHEFGHAYANAIEGKKLYYSQETWPRAVEFENLQRDTYSWPERRLKEKNE